MCFRGCLECTKRRWLDCDNLSNPTNFAKQAGGEQVGKAPVTPKRSKIQTQDPSAVFIVDGNSQSPGSLPHLTYWSIMWFYTSKFQGQSYRSHPAYWNAASMKHASPTTMNEKERWSPIKNALHSAGLVKCDLTHCPETMISAGSLCLLDE